MRSGSPTSAPAPAGGSCGAGPPAPDAQSLLHPVAAMSGHWPAGSRYCTVLNCFVFQVLLLLYRCRYFYTLTSYTVALTRVNKRQFEGIFNLVI